MKTLSVTLILGATLSACATTQGYEAVLNTWIGDSSDHLVAVWGVPQQSYPTRDGGVILQYQRSGQIVLPGVTNYHPVTTYNDGSVYGTTWNGVQVNGSYNGTSTTYVPQTLGPVVIPQACATRFTVDAGGRITTGVGKAMPAGRKPPPRAPRRKRWRRRPWLPLTGAAPRIRFAPELALKVSPGKSAPRRGGRDAPVRVVNFSAIAEIVT